MPNRKTAPLASGNITTWAAAAAILLLIIVIGGIAWKNLAPQGPVPVHTATSDWMEKLARESGGDFNKLSPADQLAMNQKTLGKGALYLKRKYDSLH